jgi:membrane-associated phospholipid phosphatase
MDTRAKTLLGMAAGCVVLFVLVTLGAYAVTPTQTLDLEGLGGFMSVNHGWVGDVTIRVVQLGDPAQVALIALALAALAVVRGRPRVAIVVLALIAATSVSSQLLKALLAHPRVPPFLGYVVGPEALPSGHATAAMSLALAGVLAAPRRARLAAAVVGSLLALGVGASVITWGWHYPSDVVAGYLLATGWALALVAVLYEVDRRHPASGRLTRTALARASDRIAARGLALGALGGVAVATLVAAAELAGDPHAAAWMAREHTAFVVVAGAIAAAAVALPVALARLMRRG